MKSKLKFVIPLALVLALGGYKFVLAKPAPAPKPKIAGTVYVLPNDFLLNLTDGKFVKLDVALVLSEVPVAAAAEAAAAPPEGYGSLPQEAAVRDIITNLVTDSTGRALVSRTGRERLKARILKQIKKTTDVKATAVLFTDVAVQ
jgi:flagellar basal body-associated protein FliL